MNQIRLSIIPSEFLGDELKIYSFVAILSKLCGNWHFEEVLAFVVSFIDCFCLLSMDAYKYFYSP